MCKKFKFGYTNKWYMDLSWRMICTNLLFDFQIQMDELISTRRTDLVIIKKKTKKKKKRAWWIVVIAFPENHRVKLKEIKTRDKCLDLATELNKIWNMTVRVILIVTGALVTDIKGLSKGLKDLKIGERLKTIQITALLKSTRILRRVLKTWTDLLKLKFQSKTIS